MIPRDSFQPIKLRSSTWLIRIMVLIYGQKLSDLKSRFISAFVVHYLISIPSLYLIGPARLSKAGNFF